MYSDWSRIMSYLAIITLCEVIIVQSTNFQMATVGLLDVFEEEMNKMKENTISVIITCAIIIILIKNSYSPQAQ